MKTELLTAATLKDGKGEVVTVMPGEADLPPDVVADLKAKDAARDPVPKTKQTVEADQRTDAERAADARMDKIMGIVAGFTPGNTDHFTGQGTPRVEAVSAALGEPASKEEVAEAWKRVQKAAAG